MTICNYPQDSINLRNSEGVILNKLLQRKTTLEYLKSGSQPSPDDILICVDVLEEVLHTSQNKLNTVGYKTMQ